MFLIPHSLAVGWGGQRQYFPFQTPPTCSESSFRRKPESRSSRYDDISLDSGSRYAARRSSGM